MSSCLSVCTNIVKFEYEYDCASELIYQYMTVWIYELKNEGDGLTFSMAPFASYDSFILLGSNQRKKKEVQQTN